jgi:hypothetical protein
VRSLEQFNDLFPAIYNDCKEIEYIGDADYEALKRLNDAYLRLRNNQFVISADMLGLIEYERVLNIAADPATETIDFRRKRILDRITTLPPFTYNYLQSKLDEVVGVGRWISNIDYVNYRLEIHTFLQQDWYNEFIFIMNLIKPANIVFINSPLSVTYLQIAQRIFKIDSQWNYKLGQWQLGALPFMSDVSTQEIKPMNVPSITDFTLEEVAMYVKDQVKTVVLNESYTVPYIGLLSASGHTISIGYSIDLHEVPGDLITKIEIFDKNGNKLVYYDANVTITQETAFRHNIYVEEVLQ